MKKSALVFLVLVVMFTGCVSSTYTPEITEQEVPPVQESTDQSQAAEESAPETSEAVNESEVLRIIARMSSQEGQPVYSFDTAQVVNDYAPFPFDLSDPVVLKTSREYYYEEEKKVSEFEFIFFGVDPAPGISGVEKDDTIGNATGPMVNLIARTKDLDPYLVACTSIPPVQEEGHWYYYPGMYDSSQMKWLSFAPAEYEEFKSMYDHALEPENVIGMTMINWWVHLKTELQAYPEKSFKDGKEVAFQQIMFKDIPLNLNYQENFHGYLTNEYTLGQPIYLFLQINAIIGSEMAYNCYVRDFSLVPPEEVVADRIDYLTGE